MTYSIGDIVRSNSKADIRDGKRLCRIRDIKEEDGKTMVKLLYWDKRWGAFDWPSRDNWRSLKSITSMENNRDDDI